MSIKTRDEVAIITVDDGKANALSFDLIEGIRKAVSEGQEARAIVLTGRPGYFCAGLDLSVVKGGDRERIEQLLADACQLFRDMMTAARPVVAACTGHALAGGALLLLSSDLRIGERNESKIGLIEAAVGLPLGEFGFALASLRLSRQSFVRATTLAQVSRPDDAVTEGFLDEVVEEDAVSAAIERAVELSARLDLKAFASCKRMAYESVLSGSDNLATPT